MALLSLGTCAIVGLGGGGCYSHAQYLAWQEERSVDLVDELGELYTCSEALLAHRSLDTGLADGRRIVVSAWQSEPASGDEPAIRWRLILEVIVDPNHGPGVRVTRDRQGWSGSDEPAWDAPAHPGPSGAGWQALARSSADGVEEREVGRWVQACWRSSFQRRHGSR